MSDTEAVYARRVETLRNMARELGIPPGEAVRLIEECMFASLLRRGDLDTDRFLAASMRCAAKRRMARV